MGIKGMTDNVRATFPSLGRLRKGAPKVEERRPGLDLKFFRFDSPRLEVQAAFEATYGKEPVFLPVYLPYATVEDNFSAWREKYAAGGIIHRCDGETMEVWRDVSGAIRHDLKPCPYHNKAQTDEQKKADPPCRPVGRLTVILPQMLQAGHVGYVTLVTHSINDIISIQSSLVATREARGGNALGLRGILFALRRAPQKISTPSKEGRVPREKWLVYLEPSVEWVRLQIETAHSQAMGLLPSGVLAPTTGLDEDDGDDGADEREEGEDARIEEEGKDGVEDSDYEEGDFEEGTEEVKPPPPVEPEQKAPPALPPVTARDWAEFLQAHRWTPEAGLARANAMMGAKATKFSDFEDGRAVMAAMVAPP